MDSINFNMQRRRSNPGGPILLSDAARKNQRLLNIRRRYKSGTNSGSYENLSQRSSAYISRDSRYLSGTTSLTRSLSYSGAHYSSRCLRRANTNTQTDRHSTYLNALANQARIADTREHKRKQSEHDNKRVDNTIYSSEDFSFLENDINTDISAGESEDDIHVVTRTIANGTTSPHKNSNDRDLDSDGCSHVRRSKHGRQSRRVRNRRAMSMYAATNVGYLTDPGLFDDDDEDINVTKKNDEKNNTRLPANRMKKVSDEEKSEEPKESCEEESKSCVKKTYSSQNKPLSDRSSSNSNEICGRIEIDSASELAVNSLDASKKAMNTPNARRLAMESPDASKPAKNQLNTTEYAVNQLGTIERARKHQDASELAMEQLDPSKQATETHDASKPDMAPSDASQPAVNQPGAIGLALNSTNASELVTDTPGAGKLAMGQPDTNEPAVNQLGKGKHAVKQPDTSKHAVNQSGAIELALNSTNASELVMDTPDTGKPIIDQPDTNEPAENQLDKSKSAVNQPDTSKQDLSPPNASKPAINPPDKGELAIKTPDPTKQTVNSLDASKSGMNQLDVSKPSLNQLDISVHAVNQPDASEPSMDQPEARKLRVNILDASKPAVDQPEARKLVMNTLDASKPALHTPNASKRTVNPSDANNTVDSSVQDVNLPDVIKPDLNPKDASKQTMCPSEASKPALNQPDTSELKSECTNKVGYDKRRKHDPMYTDGISTTLQDTENRRDADQTEKYGNMKVDSMSRKDFMNSQDSCMPENVDLPKNQTFRNRRRDSRLLNSGSHESEDQQQYHISENIKAGMRYGNMSSLSKQDPCAHESIYEIDKASWNGKADTGVSSKKRSPNSANITNIYDENTQVRVTESKLESNISLDANINCNAHIRQGGDNINTIQNEAKNKARRNRRSNRRESKGLPDSNTPDNSCKQQITAKIANIYDEAQNIGGRANKPKLEGTADSAVNSHCKDLLDSNIILDDAKRANMEDVANICKETQQIGVDSRNLRSKEKADVDVSSNRKGSLDTNLMHGNAKETNIANTDDGHMQTRVSKVQSEGSQDTSTLANACRRQKKTKIEKTDEKIKQNTHSAKNTHDDTCRQDSAANITNTSQLQKGSASKLRNEGLQESITDRKAYRQHTETSKANIGSVMQHNSVSKHRDAGLLDSDVHNGSHRQGKKANITNTDIEINQTRGSLSKLKSLSSFDACEHSKTFKNRQVNIMNIDDEPRIVNIENGARQIRGSARKLKDKHDYLAADFDEFEMKMKRTREKMKMLLNKHDDVHERLQIDESSYEGDGKHWEYFQKRNKLLSLAISKLCRQEGIDVAELESGREYKWRFRRVSYSEDD